MKVSEATIDTKGHIPLWCGHCGNKRTLFAFRLNYCNVRICPKCQKRTGVMDHNTPVKSRNN